MKERFAEDEVLNPRPGLNSRIIESVVRGNSVIASYEEVRDANTRGDLQQVILQTRWKDRLLKVAERDEVRVLMGRAYQELYAGYRFSRILRELVDELDFWDVQGYPSLQIIDRFDRYRQANPDSTWNSPRALAVVTIESTRSDPGSVVAGLFHHRREPQFGFARGEQELLEVALEGVDDASASRSLFVSRPAIKRRWENIFDRVTAVRPDLCPDDGDGTRGTQKRQRILTYVRNHPEELRPFDFSKQQTQEKG